MTCIAIIPARGGSRRIPRKNIREFHGKPIIAYSIEAAKASGMFDHIFVSTDDFEIAKIAEGFDAIVYWRDPKMAEDHVGTQEVMRHALSNSVLLDSDFACCIYATSPLMSHHDLKSSYYLIHPSKRAYVYSVCGWRDAAQFYWGSVEAFRESVPLDHWSTARFEIAPERFCDINTEEDWQRAEQMYLALKGQA